MAPKRHHAPPVRRDRDNEYSIPTEGGRWLLVVFIMDGQPLALTTSGVRR